MLTEDIVDRIVQQWREERPDLDLDPLGVFSRITRISKRLSQVRSQAFERSGLNAWEFDVLSVLRKAGEPFRQSPKALLQETMVSSGTMTNRIDGMVKRGLVKRLPDPGDGRGVLVEITPLGLTLVDAAITRLTDAEEQLLTGLTRAERDRLTALLRKLSVGLETGE